MSRYYDRDRSRSHKSSSYHHHRHDDFNTKSYHSKDTKYNDKKPYQNRNYYHEIASSTRSNRLPLPYQLAEPIWRTLKNRDGQLEIIQGLDAKGRSHLLVYVSASEERSIAPLGPGKSTEVSDRDLSTRYQVLSPIHFESAKELQKKMDKLRKQSLQVVEDAGDDDAQRREDGFWRCQYEWGRLFKRAFFDDLPIHQFQISTPVDTPRIVALCITRWDVDHSEVTKNTVMDLGIAYGEVCANKHAHVKKEETRVKKEEQEDQQALLGDNNEAIRTCKAATRRIKVKPNTRLRLKHADEVLYPILPSEEPDRTEILDEHLIGNRLKELLASGSSKQPVILLINDISKTQALLENKFNVDLSDVIEGGCRVELGLNGLFRSSEPPRSYDSYSRKRSRSPSPPWKRESRSRERDYASYASPSRASRSSSVHRDRRPNHGRVHIHLVDTKAIFERVSKTHDVLTDRGYVRGMHQRLGLSSVERGFAGKKKTWNAAVDAELTIKIFNALIHGTSIEEEYERFKVPIIYPMPQDQSVSASVGTAVSGTGTGGCVDQDEDDDDDEERDPNDIVHRKPNAAQESGGNAPAVPSYEDYSDYGEDDEEY